MTTTMKDAQPMSTLSTPSDREIRTERILHAPRARVWSYAALDRLLAS